MNLEGGEMTEIGEMPQGWKVVRLGDASLNITDGSHFSPKDDKNGDYRIGTVANMTENQIDIDSCKKISKEDYEMLVKNGCKPKIGDVLFSKDGTVGLSFSFKQNDDIVLLSSIAIISPKESLYPDYCAYVLKSPLVFKQIEGSKRGTGLRRIILHDLKRFQIPLPPLPEQRRIAEILSAVDRKLELERRRKEKLERVKKGLMNELLTGRKRLKNNV
ncbi:Type-1 restriction enzyme MjaXIP specificity protein [uncultured archaeon]|nr:Type-1 restriction enzyme MjaXIP specificity protein [uncultured archaeon]